MINFENGICYKVLKNSDLFLLGELPVRLAFSVNFERSANWSNIDTLFNSPQISGLK